MIPNIALYAPMKPPHHPTPSGDRRMARLLIKALRRGGYTTQLASSFRSRNRDGSALRQNALEQRASAERSRVLQRFANNPPDLWLTYHSYYKAPDLIGPFVSQALDIPYVLVEASHAPKRDHGPWRRGQALALHGVAQADLILQPNPGDIACVSDAVGETVRQVLLPPFLDLAALKQGLLSRADARRVIAQEQGLDPNVPWIVTTAMMRPDAKLTSYQVLGSSLQDLGVSDFQLIVIGDGAARQEVERALFDVPRVHYLGVVDDIAPVHRACDLFVWPAIEEAFGFASLEAQAVGLPGVLGDRPGVRAMVRDGETALLTPEGNAAAFGAAVADLLADHNRRSAMGEAAERHVAERHGINAAAALLRREFSALGVGRA